MSQNNPFKGKLIQINATNYIIGDHIVRFWVNQTNKEISVRLTDGARYELHDVYYLAFLTLVDKKLADK